MAVNILGLLLFSSLGIFLYSGGSFNLLKAPFQDYQESRAFKERTGLYFSDLLDLLANSDLERMRHQQAVKERLNNEDRNLIYYAINEDSSLVIQSENEIPVLLTSDSKPHLPAGYNYCWYFDGEKVQIFHNGKPVDTKRLDSGYHDVISNAGLYTNDPSKLSNSYIVLAVKNDLQANPYGQSMYYWEQQLLSVLGWVYIVLGIIGIVLLIYAIIRRQDKRRFDRMLASWSKGTWLEIKLLVSLFLIFILAMVTFRSSPSDIFNVIR